MLVWLLSHNAGQVDFVLLLASLLACSADLATVACFGSRAVLTSCAGLVVGLVDSAEMAELVYLVERQKKRLHFGAPTLRVPPLAKELWQHPLFRGFTAQDRAEVNLPQDLPMTSRLQCKASYVATCAPTAGIGASLITTMQPVPSACE